ncbi:MAG: excinuclease ABC subunit UvrA [Cytophagaceae bacterium]|nr:excinuclease ABC subunit UvrA [Cytophagaceae bacterium]MDW8455542.1 excinuclease ABC subunit UvrA [Cytophagaceae bacterium]
MNTQEQHILEKKHEATGYEYLEVYGAREHNLKNIDVTIPRNKLIVLTGISGSGKSSLAFDTLYAEGQRRYMESFSAYARSFIGNMERPDVDKIEGLSPVISIEQKTTTRNPRSTVGTMTEVYDFLRLLYARAADAYSYVTGEKMCRQSEDQIVDHILRTFNNKKITLLAPVVKGRKGHYHELFFELRKRGFTKVRVDGVIKELVPRMMVDRFKTHDIEIVIDNIHVSVQDRLRLSRSVSTAMTHGKGVIMVLYHDSQKHEDKTFYYSKFLMDPVSGISYDEPAPNMFSFNSPYGACPLCDGLGIIEEFTIDSIIPEKNLSISRGAIVPLGEYRDIWIYRQIESFLKKNGAKISTPIKNLSQEVLNMLLYGNKEGIDTLSTFDYKFNGVFNYLRHLKETDEHAAELLSNFMVTRTCRECGGYRLKKESLHFKIDGKNISELAQMDIAELYRWFEGIEERLSERQNIIAAEILKEIRKRLRFLLDIGLDYLTLDRPLRALSGGESQRIRLATQIGTQLVGVLYILDEPSIGLHQRDNMKLIEALKSLRDLGNTVIVVEHDKDMMLHADYIIDIGPGAGIHGGRIVAQGPPEVFKNSDSLTARYLKGVEKIEIPAQRRKGNGNYLTLKGAKGNNLKNVTLRLPLGKMICITGVSGSGKSSLIHDTLFPILNRHFYGAHREPLPYEAIEGLNHIDKVIEIDQSPIGRTPRSNPATYTEVFTDIRNLFAQIPESKIRGYKPGRFSFNVKGGRCEACEGAGIKKIEMDFLPDVYIPCDICKGKRYNRETLEIRYKSKSIADVLDMTVEQAVVFFENHPSILRKIETLNDVGLSYITLGQHATTLSGGEAQRVKLATELSRKDTGNTLYILDEPTTGLHFEDIQHLLNVLNKLVDKGNTVLIIEHNLDLIKVADYIIDMGPEGGLRGGNIVCEGTPEEIAGYEHSYTGKFLRYELSNN